MARYTTNIPIIVNRDPYIEDIDNIITAIKGGTPPAVGDTMAVPFSNGTIWDYFVVDVASNGDVIYEQEENIFGLPANQSAYYYTTVVAEQKADRSYADASTIRNTLNEYIFGMYPAILKNAIKEKTGRYSYPFCNSANYKESTDKVWLPSLNNILDPNVSHTNIGASAENLDINSTDELFDYYIGSRYEGNNQNNINRKVCRRIDGSAGPSNKYYQPTATAYKSKVYDPKYQAYYGPDFNFMQVHLNNHSICPHFIIGKD